MFSVDARHFYNTKKVWALTAGLPVEVVPVGEVAWMLETPQWDDSPGAAGGGLSAREVLDDPAAHPAHAERIARADLSFPILVAPVPRADSRGLGFAVADGTHRLARAVRDGANSVSVRRVPPAALAAALEFVEGGAGETKGPGAPAEPKGYFAIISGEVPAEARAAIVAACNSRANAHGAVIKALLVSKAGAEGLDCKWLRETHVVEPYWDNARLDQVTARAVRLGSHDGLPPAEREVQPYVYVAVPNRAVYEQMLPRDREPQTIDEIFYGRALERYETNAAFRQLLAEVCLECGTNGYKKCRACVPTDAPLFHADPALDLRRPDPCEPGQAEAVVQATPLEVGGVTYFYRRDPKEALGFAFYAFSADLGAYAPLDPADPAVLTLLRALPPQAGGDI